MKPPELLKCLPDLPEPSSGLPGRSLRRPTASRTREEALQSTLSRLSRSLFKQSSPSRRRPPCDHVYHPMSFYSSPDNSFPNTASLCLPARRTRGVGGFPSSSFSQFRTNVNANQKGILLGCAHGRRPRKQSPNNDTLRGLEGTRIDCLKNVDMLNRFKN